MVVYDLRLLSMLFIAGDADIVLQKQSNGKVCMYKRDKCGVNGIISLFGDCDRFIVESFCCNKAIIISIIS